MSFNCLHIKNTLFSETEIYKIFSKYGNITNIQIIKYSGVISSGIYVDFETDKDCDKAYINCNNITVDNKNIGKITKLANLRNFRFWKNICSSYNACIFNLYNKCKNGSHCPQHHISFEELGYIESLNTYIDLNIFCPRKYCNCIKEHNPELLKIRWIYNMVLEELSKYFIFKEKKVRLNRFISKMNLDENCLICNDAISNGIASCSHKCCENCWAEIMKTNNRCPFCRLDISQIIWLDQL